MFARQYPLANLKIIFPLCLILGFPGIGYPQDRGITRYPNRPITFIIPSLPGADSDLACRLIAREAEKILGQPIVIMNKPGGSFTIGIAAIANSKPDGYTLGTTPSAGMFLAPLIEKVPYHPVNDLKKIIQFGCNNMAVIVKTNSPFKSFKDVLAYAQRNPKKLTFGSGGAGSFGHLIMNQIAKIEKVQFTFIPFKGAPETSQALLGGHIDFMSGVFLFPLLEAGQTRLLLVLGEKRYDEYPDGPTLKDLGYDMPTPTFINVAGPKGIPEGIANKLESVFTSAIKKPAFIKGMKDARLTIVYRNSRELSDYVTKNYNFFSGLLKEMGFAK